MNWFLTKECQTFSWQGRPFFWAYAPGWMPFFWCSNHDGSRLTSPCCSPRGCHWKSFERAKWRAWSVWRISLDLLIRYEWIAKIFCRFLVILFGNISDAQIYLGWWWSFVHMFLEVKLPTRFDRFSLAPRSKYKISLGKSYIAHYETKYDDWWLVQLRNLHPNHPNVAEGCRRVPILEWL